MKMPLIQTPEQPIYVLNQNKSRALIPKFLSLVVLSVLFYIGILVNISLLDLSAKQETQVKVLSLAILAVIDLIGVYVAFRRSAPYKFYATALFHNNKSIDYSSIVNTTPHKEFWDKLFKTYSINVGNHFYLRNIPQQIEIQNYLQQLIRYTKGQTSH